MSKIDTFWVVFTGDPNRQDLPARHMIGTAKPKHLTINEVAIELIEKKHFDKLAEGLRAADILISTLKVKLQERDQTISWLKDGLKQ